MYSLLMRDIARVLPFDLHLGHTVALSLSGLSTDATGLTTIATWLKERRLRAAVPDVRSTAS
jgi:hypothetical protein